MSRKKILGAHVRHLLSGVSGHGKRHLSEIETDLMQTRLLLEEAVDKLTSSFMAIGQAVCACQAGIDLLLAGGAPDAEESARLGAMASEIGVHVNSAIVCMQFEDMTSQLIEGSLKRTTGLRALLATLGAHGAGIGVDSDSEKIVERLGEVSMALAIQALELRSMLRKSVSQHHLESGDIELF